MKTKIVAKVLVLLSIVLVSHNVLGQENDMEIKLKTVLTEMEVDVTPEKAWEVLSAYGNVSDFHSIVTSSNAINGSHNEASLSCERICYIANGKRQVMVKERILEYKEGSHYKYNVYDWENFPIRKMNITYGVKVNTQNKTVIYQITDYRLKPGFLTGVMKGKMQKGAMESLMSYKHYMETGEKNVAIKVLKKQYKTA